MSGVLAMLSTDGRPIPPDLAAEMTRRMEHRGDRQPRTWCGEGVLLAHVSLPTTPEAEHEVLPAPDPSGRYWLTWDGRLDNRDELAAELQLSPGEATELTDADYVLRAHLRWGKECVRHLLGDWAFVIWDSVERKLFCAKDPVGWRYLHHAEQDGLFVVASEPRQLFANGWLAPVANEEYVLQLLAECLRDLGTTCYEGMYALEGGQWLEADEDGWSVHQYWTGPRGTFRWRARPEDIVEEFTHVFDKAVRARLRTNGPVAVSLSGGLDSSYVAAVAAKHADVVAVTAYVPGTKKWDEREFATAVARHVGIRHELVDATDAAPFSSRWMPSETVDEPDLQPSAGTFAKSAHTAAGLGARILLGGEGADEWFTGAPSPTEALLAGHWRRATEIARTRYRKRPLGTALIRDAYHELIPPGPRNMLRSFGGAKRNGHAPLSIPIRDHWQSAVTCRETALWQRSRRNDAYWRMYWNITRPVVGWRDRHVFAPLGLEGRSPFEDLRVIELLATVPEHVKQYRGRRKDLLRAAEAPVLPAVIPERDDYGLLLELMGASIGVREPDRVALAREAIEPLAGIDGLAAIDRWLEEDTPAHGPVWRFLSAGLWLAVSGVNAEGLVPVRHLAGSLTEGR